MSSEHPTYPNPTITEAVCDIHFRLPEGKEQSPSITSDSSLWEEKLAHTAYKNPPLGPSRKTLNRDESNQHVKLSAKNQAAIELLRSWCEDDEDDEEEQKATWEFLKQALDEDRLSDRKLFP